MELYQKINQFMGVFINKKFQDDPFENFPGSIHTYRSDEQIKWSDLDNIKFIQFLNILDANIEWKIIMYKKSIPEYMMDTYKDYLDWDYILSYSNIKEQQIERYEDKINWDIVSTKKHSLGFIEKHIDKINFDAIAIYQNLTERFIDEYKDKLNWIDICMYQPMSSKFINEHIEYLTDPCWINISKFQPLTKEFIIEYANKLDWKIMSVYQDLSSMKIIDEYQDRLDWNEIAMYQPLDIDIIEKYSELLNVESIINNPGIHLTSDILQLYIKNGDLKIRHINDMIDNDIDIPMDILEHFIESDPYEIRWAPANEMQSSIQRGPTEFEYKMKIHKCISEMEHLPEEFLIKHKDQIHWQVVKANNLIGLPLDLLEEKCADIICWNELILSTEMPSNFLERIVNKVSYLNWQIISEKQQLTEEFMDRHKDKIIWKIATVYQDYSEQFAIDHKNYIDWNLYMYLKKNELSDNVFIACVDNVDIQHLFKVYDIKPEVVCEMFKACQSAKNAISIATYMNKENIQIDYKQFKKDPEKMSILIKACIVNEDDINKKSIFDKIKGFFKK